MTSFRLCVKCEHMSDFAKLVSFLNTFQCVDAKRYCYNEAKQWQAHLKRQAVVLDYLIGQQLSFRIFDADLLVVVSFGEEGDGLVLRVRQRVEDDDELNPMKYIFVVLTCH